jgi:hypothetical protein
VHLNDPLPEPALSPDEAHTWHAIERSLRSELPLERIERRARLRTDRVLWAGAALAAAGTVIGTLALLAPISLVLVGALAAGLGTGTLACRAFATIIRSRRQSRRPSLRRPA